MHIDIVETLERIPSRQITPTAREKFHAVDTLLPLINVFHGEDRHRENGNTPKRLHTTRSGVSETGNTILNIIY